MKTRNCLVRFFSAVLLIELLAAMAVGLADRGKSNSAGSGGSGGSGQASDMEPGAQDAAVAEVKKHWIKTAEGWITARTSGTSFAPDHFLRQLRR